MKMNAIAEKNVITATSIRHSVTDPRIKLSHGRHDKKSQRQHDPDGGK